jgi:hypothetical protein
LKWRSGIRRSSALGDWGGGPASRPSGQSSTSAASDGGPGSAEYVTTASSAEQKVADLQADIDLNRKRFVSLDIDREMAIAP